MTSSPSYHIVLIGRGRSIRGLDTITNDQKNKILTSTIQTLLEELKEGIF